MPAPESMMRFLDMCLAQLVGLREVVDVGTVADTTDDAWTGTVQMMYDGRTSGIGWMTADKDPG